MRSVECGHYGRYDRTFPDCGECGNASLCRAVSARCYGREYSMADGAACRTCELAEYCRGAGDIHFYANRHGEPSISATDEIESFAGAAEEKAVAPELAEALDGFFADCGYSPVRIAVAVARHGGATFTEIGRMMGGHPKQWAAWQLRGIMNRALREYLLNKKTGKFFSSAIREEVRKNRTKKKPRRTDHQLDLFEEEKKKKKPEQLVMF